MDLSSSATQRNASSESLSIQPGSVRSSATDAANEFARHLAENARTEPRHGRDDRPVSRAERDDRRAERSHTSREDETKARETARKENEPVETRADESDEADKVVSAEQQTVEIAPAVEAEEGASGTEPLMEETAEAQAGSQTSETGDETATAEQEDETAKTAVNATAAPATPETAIGTAVQPKVDIATDTSGKSVASGDQVGAATSSKKAAPTGTPLPEASAAVTTAVASATKTKTESGGTSIPGAQTGTTSDGEATDTATQELKLGEQAKPAKGLGQEAAEQLANRKADGKQATEQPKAGPQTQAAVAQPQRTAAQPAAPLATPPADASATARGGELPANATQQTATNGNTATVRIGTLPGQSQPTQVPAAAIALQMARNLQKGVSRFDIRLDPPEMGRVDVRMEVRKDGHVVAHMTVERPETLDLLQRDARALQQALNNAGLQADSDSLNFTLRDQIGRAHV